MYPLPDIFTLPDEVAKVMVLGVGGRGSPRESEREERESPVNSVKIVS